MPDSTIPQDVRDEGASAPETDVDGAANAFLSAWEEDGVSLSDPEEKEANTKDEAATAEPEGDEEDVQTDDPDTDDADDEDGDEAEDEDDSTDDDDTDDDGEDEDQDDEASDPQVAQDDAVVEVTVDGETKNVTVSELKRLAGQEAAITQKSQQIAQKRKEVEQTAKAQAAGLERLYEGAKERWSKYANQDMLVLSQQMKPEDFAAYRKEAQAAYQDFKFMEQELGTFVQEMDTQRQNALREKAREAIQVLSDPSEGIPGWNAQVYDSIRDYAVQNGMESEIVNNLVDPAAIKLIHKAMMYDQTKAKAKTKKAKPKSAKRTMKSKTPMKPQDAKSQKVQKTSQRLKTSGSVDDAADAFLARWSD